MHRLKVVIYNCCLALVVLLLFLLLFEAYLQVPLWLQVFGRMHPLLLHFPVVLFIINIGFLLFAPLKFTTAPFKEVTDWFLLLMAFTSLLTALMGLFLSKEDGYESDLLSWHKYLGVAAAVVAFCWYSFRNSIAAKNSLRYSVLFCSTFLIILTGHNGAGITHGNDFVWAPVTTQPLTEKVLLEDAIVFEHVVQPILKNKCISCHNQQKAKGNLVMETAALLLKGGKSGKLWDTTAAQYGLLLSRIHLPETAKKHMPPAGKPQLTAQETAILYHWIKGGADFTKKLIEYPDTDSLRMIAAGLFSTIDTKEYEFAAADEATIKKLNTEYRSVQPLAIGSPALEATFFNAAAFTTTAVKELLPLKEQLISLNLARMPLKDDDINTIIQFKNLRKLNLSFTGLKGNQLAVLAQLKALKQLSLSGNGIGGADVLQLAALKNISQLYLWNTLITAPEAEKLKETFKNSTIDLGYTGSDTTILKLTPPLLKNESVIFNKPTPLLLKHYINGVAIHYTTDGTEPDSLKAPVYKQDIVLKATTTVKAKAFRKGWIASDILETTFYSAGIKIDTIINLRPPDDQYKASSEILYDMEKGDAGNYRNGKWLGYRNNNMESLVVFDKPRQVSDITLSSVIDPGAYIMPPQQIEIWGGSDRTNMKRLYKGNPSQPVKMQPLSVKGFSCSFKPVLIKFVKIVVVPVAKLPAWHPGKGQKGWVFTDELLVN